MASGVHNALELLCNTPEAVLLSAVDDLRHHAGFTILQRAVAERPAKSMSTTYPKAVALAKKLVTGDPAQVIGHPLFWIDPRLADLGEDNQTLAGAIRKACSQVSLAIDYCWYEYTNRMPLYVKRLLRDIRQSQSRKANISSFVETLKLQERTGEQLKKAIRNGLKVIWLLAYAPEYPRLALVIALASSGTSSANYLDLHQLVADLQTYRPEPGDDSNAGHDSGWRSGPSSSTTTNKPPVSLHALHQFVLVKDEWLSAAMDYYERQCNITRRCGLTDLMREITRPTSAQRPPCLALEQSFNNVATTWCPREYDWPIFYDIFEGRVDQAVARIRNQSATLYDEDPYGLGLGQYAAYYCCKNKGLETSLEMCTALSKMGVRLDNHVDELGNTAAETLIDNALMAWATLGRDLQGTLRHIATLTGEDPNSMWQEYLEVRQFPAMHRRLFGLEPQGRPLRSDLSQREDATVVVDEVDRRGRSALAWAAEYGWSAGVRYLLTRGANARQWRASQRDPLPLLHLVIAGADRSDATSGYMDIVEQLIRHGADVDECDHEGWTPFHVAASWNNVNAVERMASCGEKPIDWRRRTLRGETAWDLSGEPSFLDECVKVTHPPAP